MIILALDLSLNGTGYAVLNIAKKDQINILEKGVILQHSADDTGVRLLKIHNTIDELLKKYEINVCVREKGFTKFHKATQQLFKVAGVAEMTCAIHGFELLELAPISIKKYITGNGKASKEEVKDKLYDFVGEQEYKTTDVSDAVAVGISYAIKEEIL